MGAVSEDRLLQPSPIPATSYTDRLRTGIGRRTIGIGFALLIEGLLLLALLSLGPEKQPGKKEARITAVNLDADQPLEEPAEPSSAEPEQRAKEQPTPNSRQQLNRCL